MGVSISIPMSQVGDPGEHSGKRAGDRHVHARPLMLSGAALDAMPMTSTGAGCRLRCTALADSSHLRSTRIPQNSSRQRGNDGNRGANRRLRGTVSLRQFCPNAITARIRVRGDNGQAQTQARLSLTVIVINLRADHPAHIGGLVLLKIGVRILGGRLALVMVLSLRQSAIHLSHRQAVLQFEITNGPQVGAPSLITSLFCRA